MEKHILTTTPRELGDVVTAWLKLNAQNLDKLYCWPFPPSNPFGFELKPYETLAERNRRLRRFLSTLWHQGNNTKRGEIVKWYVGVWGGINANKPEKISAYATLSDSDLQKLRSGIASWSKVLAVRNPNQFAIYDSWVALSLNIIQLREAHKLIAYFPMPPWRHLKDESGLRERAQKVIKTHPSFATAEKLPMSRAYGRYLSALKTGTPPDSSIEQCEMVLFASGEQLALSLLRS